MTKKELEKLEVRYRAKAERAYMRYQETGIQRYANEWRNAEDISDALLMAINAADEHTELIHMRGNLSQLVQKAQDAINGSEADKDRVLKDIVCFGVMKKLIMEGWDESRRKTEAD